MKRFQVTLFLCLLSLYALCADINLNDIRLIDQKLENILRETLDLPQQKKVRIAFEVESIKRILDKEREKGTVEMAQLIEKNNTPSNNFKPKSPYMPIFTLYDDKELSLLKARIRGARPYKNQLAYIKQINNSSSFTIEQIKDIVEEISLTSDKKEVVKILLPNAVDLENVDQLYDLFKTDSDKQDLDKIAEQFLH